MNFTAPQPLNLPPLPPPPVLSVTTELPGMLVFEVPETFEAMVNQGGSPVGNSAVSTFLSCPERSRLNRLGLRRKGFSLVRGADLDARGFGSLMHTLLATRVVHGYEKAIHLLGPLTASTPFAPEAEMWSYGLGLSMEDRFKASALLNCYDYEFPLEDEPFEYIGVESNVVTDLGGGELRTVRYDAVVRMHDGSGLFSLEHKTAARDGDLNGYTPQFAVQVAIWNANPHLVERYGPMTGVIPDVLVKTKVPKCHRPFPLHIPKHFQQLAVEYMLSTSAVKFPVYPDGHYPRFLHACWGRWGACEYTPLCWEGSTGQFEVSSNVEEVGLVADE